MSVTGWTHWLDIIDYRLRYKYNEIFGNFPSGAGRDISASVHEGVDFQVNKWAEGGDPASDAVVPSSLLFAGGFVRMMGLCGRGCGCARFSPIWIINCWILVTGCWVNSCGDRIWQQNQLQVYATSRMCCTYNHRLLPVN